MTQCSSSAVSFTTGGTVVGCRKQLFVRSHLDAGPACVQGAAFDKAYQPNIFRNPGVVVEA